MTAEIISLRKEKNAARYSEAIDLVHQEKFKPWHQVVRETLAWADRYNATVMDIVNMGLNGMPQMSVVWHDPDRIKVALIDYYRDFKKVDEVLAAL